MGGQGEEEGLSRREEEMFSFWSSFSGKSVNEICQILFKGSGLNIPAVLKHAKDVANKAHSVYMASNNAYYLANDRAVYDDRVQGRKNWDYYWSGLGPTGLN